MERWRKIKGFNYLVSDSGKVKAVRTGKLLNQYECNGYYRVDLYINAERRKPYVHQLVCETFKIKPNLNYSIVNHRDGNRKNNHYKNLEWSTHSLNNKHAYRVLGRICPPRESGANSPHAKVIIQTTLGGVFVKEHGSIVDAQKEYGSCIERCLSGRNKTSYGFIWKYK